MDIVQWNKSIEDTGKLPENEEDQVIDAFLWGSNPYEIYHNDVLYNKNHLLGMLLCRSYDTTNTSDMLDDRLRLIDTHPKDMNFKQLKDTLANLQFEWPQFINKVDNDEKRIEKVKSYIQICMSRVGKFIGYSHPDKILNDAHDTCMHTDGQKKLTPSAVRRVIGSILIINRHVDLYDMCEEIAPCNYQTGITLYHHEASMENFHKLCMHYYLPAAAKLHYKHDFPGMYNDVSQAVYFHDAEYKRIKREDYTSTSPIHMLPSVCLLYPSVPVKFEDDMFDPYEDQGWYWILLPQRVYLVSPEPKVYYSTDLSALLGLYVKSLKT